MLMINGLENKATQIPLPKHSIRFLDDNWRK